MYEGKRQALATRRRASVASPAIVVSFVIHSGREGSPSAIRLLQGQVAHVFLESQRHDVRGCQCAMQEVCKGRPLVALRRHAAWLSVMVSATQSILASEMVTARREDF